MKMKIGISACLLGTSVRYNGGHKLSRFCHQQLNEIADFDPVCPEVAIGLPVPRPTLRLEGNDDLIRIVMSDDNEQDYTQPMEAFAKKKAANMDQLHGFVFCAKSPSCGMERVKRYVIDSNWAERDGIGIFAKAVMDANPTLPVEEDGRLNDPMLRENFVARLYIRRDWLEFMQDPSVAGLQHFHRDHKFQLLAHDPKEYYALGKVVANASADELDALCEEYILRVMTLAKKVATRKSHTNVMQHMQGFFKKYLSQSEKSELHESIMQYRNGELPLLAPLQLFKHYINKYPSTYLKAQTYMRPHPDALRLRLSL